MRSTLRSKMGQITLPAVTKLNSNGPKGLVYLTAKSVSKAANLIKVTFPDPGDDTKFEFKIVVKDYNDFNGGDITEQSLGEAMEAAREELEAALQL